MDLNQILGLIALSVVVLGVIIGAFIYCAIIIGARSEPNDYYLVIHKEKRHRVSPKRAQTSFGGSRHRGSPKQGTSFGGSREEE